MSYLNGVQVSDIVKNGGTLPSRLTTGASGVVKASAGRFLGYELINTNAAARYLQIYNKATAGVPGTDTPVLTLPLAAGQARGHEYAIGLAFATGISWAVTTDAAGATAGTSGDIVGSLLFA